MAKTALSFLLLITSAGMLRSATPRAAADEFFESRIRPILANNCFACHTASKMGGLDMRSRESLLKGGNHGPAIVPGDPGTSLLVQAIRHEHQSIKMPPMGKLTDGEIDLIATWIREGAIWPDAPPSDKSGYVITAEQRAFWSFQPVRKPAPPVVRERRWVKQPIDNFILKQLEAKSLTPVQAADKSTLIRRATYDVTGLPPTAEEVDAFVADRSPGAFAKVVDRLLASPRYGEKWGRHWLDVARYSDDKLDSERDNPHPNAFRYRDWVIQAFNDDMPYDVFVKAQIAGDLLPNPEKGVAGLGLYALSPEFQDDRVDVTTRGFLGLTVACAQCHDHKFDPIPQKDYYALLSVFNNTKVDEYPLASPEVVEAYRTKKKLADDEEKKLKEFIAREAEQLAQILASHTSDYIRAVYRGDTKATNLDEETLKRWKEYLSKPKKDHPFLNELDKAIVRHASDGDVARLAERFQELAISVFDEKKSIDEQNLIRLGGSTERNKLSSADLVSLERDKYFLWKDLYDEKKGLFYYGEGKIDRFLDGPWKAHLEDLRRKLDLRKKDMPQQYPFFQVIRDVDEPKVQHVYLRGDKNSPGDAVPAHFLSVLCPSQPKRFTKGSGRLELAQAIADPANPLTARVMVNRVWQAHFGEGIVRTASNFGQLGERPVNPELLDYLAARFIENGWSMKRLHREIMLSAVYQLSAADSPKNAVVDPANRLLWRANRRRLDAEEIRDAVLFVSGALDFSGGGKPERLTDSNRKRTVYGFVSRRKLDSMLAVFDFPNPNATAEQRVVTNVPLQSLFLMNSSIVMDAAETLATRLTAGTDRGRIRQAYRLVFTREPNAHELQLGIEFLRTNAERPWPKYLQVLLSSNEFLFVS